MVGEPGVGKSRLFWEFTHSHRTQGWSTVESSSVSYGKATAFLPLIELLRGYFQIAAHDEERKIREKVTGKLFSHGVLVFPVSPGLVRTDMTKESCQSTRRGRRRSCGFLARL